jgi:hypothetical protein
MVHKISKMTTGSVLLMAVLALTGRAARGCWPMVTG